jgi:hypothetical protein
VPLFDLKFLGRTRGNPCRNFKSAALAAMCPNSMALTHLIGVPRQWRQRRDCENLAHVRIKFA